MLKCVASRHVVVRCSPNRANCTNHVTCDLLAAVVEKSVAGRDEGVVSIATRPLTLPDCSLYSAAVLHVGSVPPGSNANQRCTMKNTPTLSHVLQN